MKKLLFVLAAFSLLFSSCLKENLTADELLIMEIAESNEKIAIQQTDLPINVKEDCDKKYFETYIDISSLVETKGYEISMGSKDFAYYTLDGRKLEWTDKEKKGKKGKKGKDKDGKYSKCKAKFVETAYLPQSILDYMSTNHPSVVIKGAKYFYDGFYLVGTDSKDILVFDKNGVYAKTIGLFSCEGKNDWGAEIKAGDLPTPSQTYISTNYPAYSIEAAFEKDGEYFVYIYDGTTKLLVGFDNAGSFLFVK